MPTGESQLPSNHVAFFITIGGCDKTLLRNFTDTLLVGGSFPAAGTRIHLWDSHLMYSSYHAKP